MSETNKNIVSFDMTYVCTVDFGAGPVEFHLVQNTDLDWEKVNGAIRDQYPTGTHSTGVVACTDKTVSDPSRVRVKEEMDRLGLLVSDHDFIVEIMEDKKGR